MIKTFLRRISAGNSVISVLLLVNTLLLAVLVTEKKPVADFPITSTTFPSDNLTNRVLGLENQHPPVRSNEDFLGEKSHFTFSPDKSFIAFVQNVFDEYGGDWDKYWALKAFNLTTKEEKILVVDDTRMSSFQWVDNQTLRVHHHAGPGVRAYFDVKVERKEPIFTKDFVGTGLWLPDETYNQGAKEIQEAYRTYYERVSD